MGALHRACRPSRGLLQRCGPECPERARAARAPPCATRKLARARSVGSRSPTKTASACGSRAQPAICPVERRYIHR